MLEGLLTISALALTFCLGYVALPDYRYRNKIKSDFFYMISRRYLTTNLRLPAADPLSLETCFSKVLRDIEKQEIESHKVEGNGETRASASTLFLIQLCEEVPFGDHPNPEHRIKPKETRDGEKTWFHKKRSRVPFNWYLKHWDNRIIYFIIGALIILTFVLGYGQITCVDADQSECLNGLLPDFLVNLLLKSYDLLLKSYELVFNYYPDLVLKSHYLVIKFPDTVVRHSDLVPIVYIFCCIFILIPIAFSAAGRLWLCWSAQKAIRKAITKTFEVEANQATLTNLEQSIKDI